MAARARGFRAARGMAPRPAARHATLDGAVIERGVLWWRRLSPRGRRGWLGCALAALALLGGWSVTSAATLHTHAPHRTPLAAAPLTPPGSWLTHLLGLSALPTVGLVGVLGALWLAEGMARRDLMGRWLTVACCALWLTLQVGLGLALPGQGGAIGTLFTAPLTQAPGAVRAIALLLIALVAMGLALVIGGALAGVLAEGVSAIPRAAHGLLRRIPDWLHGKSAPAQRQTPSREQATRLARVIWQILHDHGAITEVSPLASDVRAIRLCVKPVERRKRGTRGQIVTDAHGRPIIVRTRISRILRLRDALIEALAQELDAPHLRMIPSEEGAAPGAGVPDGPYVIIEIA